MNGKFDWIQFPEGRARFSGIFRGWDEQGRQTFALELQGAEYFGEIKDVFNEGSASYGFSISDFGYGRGELVGMPGTGVRRAFKEDEVLVAKSLIAGLIRAGLEFKNRPSIFLPEDIAHFNGEIIFQEGWIPVELKPGEGPE